MYHRQAPGALIPLLSTLALVTGCGSSHTSLGARQLEAGTLTGDIAYSGGPSGATTRHEGGLLHVARGKALVATRNVAHGETFRFMLPPGSYSLTVSLGDLECRKAATVKPGASTSVEVLCNIK